MEAVDTMFVADDGILADDIRNMLENLGAEKQIFRAQLIQAQKMEAVGTLAGGIAHDFNNMLTAIQAYTELALKQVDKANPLTMYLSQVRLATLDAADLVRQLMLFSRRQPIELTCLDLNRMLDDWLKMLKRLVGDDIAISVDLEPDLWTIRADRVKIQQVITNLVVNARDAMPDGGKITAKTETVTIKEGSCKFAAKVPPGKFVCLSVADTGAGMDREILRHILEPFFTTKEAGKGTGLGLAVVYCIVKEYKGWIHVDSKPGRGTTFRIYLPACSVKPEAQPVRTTPLQEFQGKGEQRCSE